MSRSRRDTFERVASELAAARAVADIAPGLVEQGMPTAHAVAVSNAAQEYLVRTPGFADRAQRMLIDAGLSGEKVEQIIQLMQEAILQPDAV